MANAISMYMQIKPLIEPTRQIMKIGARKYDWYELFPKGMLRFKFYWSHVRNQLVSLTKVYLCCSKK